MSTAPDKTQKPQQQTHWDYHQLVGWFKAVGRKDAVAYFERTFMNGDGGSNGHLACKDIPQNLEDMREFPASYAKEPYTVETLEWLRAEIGDCPQVRVWW